MLIKHVRDDYRRPFATIACDYVDGRIKIGVSVCNTSDTFVKRHGRYFAIARMYTDTGVSLPNRFVLWGGQPRHIQYVMVKEIEAMVNRARRYFKLKELVS
jgi:hypothetical protein